MHDSSNFWHIIIISSLFDSLKHMNYNKKSKVVKLNFEFDEANLSKEDRIILDQLSFVTHVAEA